MKRSLISTLLLCAVVSFTVAVAPATPAVSASPSSSPPAPNAATPFARFLGTWTCLTEAGSHVTKAFTLTANGGMELHEIWRNGKLGGSWEQTFARDPRTGSWNTTNTGSNGWVFVGSSDGFHGNTIQFTGTQTTGTGSGPTRERFTMIDQGRQFNHAWEWQVGGQWRPISFADCQREKQATSPSPRPRRI